MLLLLSSSQEPDAGGGKQVNKAGRGMWVWYSGKKKDPGDEVETVFILLCCAGCFFFSKLFFNGAKTTVELMFNLFQMNT